MEQAFGLVGLGRLGRLARMAGLAIGVEAAAFWLFRWLVFLTGDLRGPDFLSFYAAARLLLARGGAHIYDLDLQRSFQDQVSARWAPLHFVILTYAHPPYVTPLLAPLGLLSYRDAYVVAGVVNLSLIAIALTLLVRSTALGGFDRAVVAALAAGFTPLFVVLLQGQTDLLMLLALTGAYLAWVRGRPGWAGILTGLALVKPNLLIGLPLLFVVAREWRAVVGLVAVVAGLAAFSLAISGPAELLTYVRLSAYSAVGGPGWPMLGGGLYSLRVILEALPAGRLLALPLLTVLLAAVAVAMGRRPVAPGSTSRSHSPPALPSARTRTSTTWHCWCSPASWSSTWSPVAAWLTREPRLGCCSPPMRPSN